MEMLFKVMVMLSGLMTIGYLVGGYPLEAICALLGCVLFTQFMFHEKEKKLLCPKCQHEKRMSNRKR